MKQNKLKIKKQMNKWKRINKKKSKIKKLKNKSKKINK